MTTDLSNFKFGGDGRHNDIMECQLCEERVHVINPGDLLSDLAELAEMHEDDCEGVED